MIKVIAAFVYFLLVAPILLIVGASLTNGNAIEFPPQGLSLRWYEAMLDDPDMLGGLWLSTQIAFAAAAGSLVVGTAAALFLWRLPLRVRSILATLFLTPLSVPLVLTGFAMLVLFTQLRLINLQGLVIAHVVITVPLIMRTALVSLSLSNSSLRDAAAILGAKPWQVIWYVVLPLLRPGLVSGTLFTFLTSFNNVTVSIFLSTPGSAPLPVVLFNRLENLVEPSVAAAAAATIFITAAGTLVLEWRFSLFRSLSASVR